MRLKILSVDWDYFFPDPSWYDWAHNEESGLFYEMVWSTRAGNHNLKTGEVAHEKFVPDRKLLDGFWDRVLDMSSHPIIYVCESHKTLGEALAGLDMPLDIWNFDQHHDLGYDERKAMDCGNWAAHAMRQNKRSKYNLVYPPWRESEIEKAPSFKAKSRTRTFFEPQGRIKPTVLFVCRSSCWTPSWSDQDWLDFLKPLEKLEGRHCWNERRTVEFVTKARHPDKDEAKSIAERMDEVNRQLQELNAR